MKSATWRATGTRSSLTLSCSYAGSRALKLDEIIRSIHHAHNEMIDIEKLSDQDLEELSKHYERIREECSARKAGKNLRNVKEKISA